MESHLSRRQFIKTSTLFTGAAASQTFLSSLATGAYPRVESGGIVEENPGAQSREKCAHSESSRQAFPRNAQVCWIKQKPWLSRGWESISFLSKECTFLERPELESHAESPLNITALLHELEAGQPAALNRLVEVAYPELRRIAHRECGRERQSSTLQCTAVVHEVWIRLAHAEHTTWNDRSHFFAFASRLMRSILIDYATGMDSSQSNYPPAEPEALRLLAPQRGVFAPG